MRLGARYEEEETQKKRSQEEKQTTLNIFQNIQNIILHYHPWYSRQMGLENGYSICHNWF